MPPVLIIAKPIGVQIISKNIFDISNGSLLAATDESVQIEHQFRPFEGRHLVRLGLMNLLDKLSAFK